MPFGITDGEESFIWEWIPLKKNGKTPWGDLEKVEVAGLLHRFLADYKEWELKKYEPDLYFQKMLP